MTTTRDLIQRLADMADALDGKKPLVFAQGQVMDGFTALANFQALANKARAYLAQPEPEGPTLEPRGCPTPGACSCPTSPTVPPDLIRALELAEAALADIGEVEREFGNDLAWAEARAFAVLPRIRAVLARWGRAARRPKLTSIALQMLDTIERDAHYLPEITDTIRRALEALSDD